jgi:hypothetical protein
VQEDHGGAGFLGRPVAVVRPAVIGLQEWHGSSLFAQPPDQPSSD